jgi:hypothetical protein
MPFGIKAGKMAKTGLRKNSRKNPLCPKSREYVSISSRNDVDVSV